MTRKEDIKNLSVEELNCYLESAGEKPYRTKQLLSWLYQKNISDFKEMTNLSLALREKLKERFIIGRMELIQKETSKLDPTQKYLFRLQDSNLIESVVIPNINRLTLCLSTQVGCRFSCGFCASGRGGFIRNLESAEIINQLQFISQDIHPVRNDELIAKNKISNRVHPQKVNNVVFMGMGEPLDNYDNLIKAIKIINHPRAFNIGARKITISTCGLPEGIKKIAKENIQVELSVSLHAANNELRSGLMPVNRVHPLEELISICREYSEDTNRLITFEYLLMKDVNDRKEDVKGLTSLLKGLRCKINLIIYNSFEEFGFKPPSIESAIEFQKRLKNVGIITTLRQSKGTDIEAACGQLRLRRLENYA